MNLYIKHSNLSTIDHPVTEENLRLIYPNLKIPQELPGEWKKFVRIKKPVRELTSVDYIFNGYSYNVLEDFFYDDWAQVEIEVQEEEVSFSTPDN